MARNESPTFRRLTRFLIHSDCIFIRNCCLPPFQYISASVVVLWSFICRLGEEAQHCCLSHSNLALPTPECAPFKGVHFSHTSCQVVRRVDRCLLRAFVTFLKSPSLISCSCHVPKPTLLFQHLSLSRNATRCTAELISPPDTPHKFQVETSGMLKFDCML